jgi:hypothetical protein
MNQTTDSPAPTLVQHGLRWGLILGVVAILMAGAGYAIDYTMLVTLKWLGIILLIDIGVAIYAGIDFRNSVGGYLSYGKAWQHAMVIFAVASLIGTIFNFVLYFVVDTELPAKLVEATLENQRAMMTSLGAPESTIETELAKARPRAENQFTASGLALGYLIILAMSAVLALISSIFVKRNEPVEM